MTCKTASPKRRAPGRPARTSGDQRDRLLDAAIALFSRQGVSATPLSAIARKARVTPALVHYYFGNRDQLLDALMTERIVPLVARMAATLAETRGEPAALVRAFVATFLRLLADHPWLPPLWVREVLSEGGALREQLMTRIAPQIAPMLAARFAEAQRQGLLNPALDPRLVVVSMIGLTIFPMAAQSIWRRLLDADDVDTDALIRHTLALLGSGLAAPATRKDS